VQKRTRSSILWRCFIFPKLSDILSFRPLRSRNVQRRNQNSMV
jgi:hypothetical protein